MKIENCFKRLLVKEPFYGIFALNLSKEVSESVKTLAVTRDGINTKLLINQEFWDSLKDDDEQLAVIKHELGHICLQHMFMSDSFPNYELFNIAADLEVNSYIEHLPSIAVTAQDYNLPSGLGTKEYYKLLSDQQQKKQGGGHGNNQEKEESPEDQGESGNQGNTPETPKDEDEEKREGEGNDDNSNFPDGKDQMDDHDKWKNFSETSEAVQTLVKNQIDKILKETAEECEKSRGRIPGNLQAYIDILRKKKPEVFNWKAYFRRLLGSIYDVNIKPTRRKPSRRFEDAMGIKHKKKVSILVAVDTSGSVSNKELQDFFSEIEHVHKAGARVTVMQFDAAITNINEYDPKAKIEIKGRGGTDFAPPIDYFKKNKKEYVSLIFFTDGECWIPEECPKDIIWIITSSGARQDYPGKTIYIPKEEQ